MYCWSFLTHIHLQGLLPMNDVNRSLLLLWHVLPDKYIYTLDPEWDSCWQQVRQLLIMWLISCRVLAVDTFHLIDPHLSLLHISPDTYQLDKQQLEDIRRVQWHGDTEWIVCCFWIIQVQAFCQVKTRVAVGHVDYCYTQWHLWMANGGCCEQLVLGFFSGGSRVPWQKKRVL